VNLILSEGSGVSERLADVFLFEVRQFLNDLRRRHAIGNKVEDVGHRNSQTPNGGTAGQNIWVLRNSIEGVRHG
jgi:hypothetical protein